MQLIRTLKGRGRFGMSHALVEFVAQEEPAYVKDLN
jgi:hypothetical protein